LSRNNASMKNGASLTVLIWKSWKGWAIEVVMAQPF
jgi:hypothetical protein